jgi:biopolymer transport protein TolR
MSMGSAPRGTMLSEINVTPLVDVMLVLLIIFMITAPLTQEGVQVEVPEAQAAAMEKKEGAVRVTIVQSGEIRIGDELVGRLNLEEDLHSGKNRTTLEKLVKDKETYVDAYHRLPYGAVVNVMVKLQEAGIRKIGLVTQPAVGD